MRGLSQGFVAWFACASLAGCGPTMMLVPDTSVPADTGAGVRDEGAPIGDVATPLDAPAIPDATTTADASQDAGRDAGSDGAGDAPASTGPCAGARDDATVRRTTRGRYTTLENVRARRLGNTRTVTVYQPEGPGPFPVLYAHDGQNLFEASRAAFGVAWELDEAIAAVEAQGLRFIVVGIDNNAARIDEYTPVRDSEYGGGRGDDYLDFVVNDLKPYVDFHFATRCEASQTAMMGSSLGGLISFYAGRRYPTVFGRIAALSPSFWWSDRQIVRDYAMEGGGDPPALWIDGGSAEGEVTSSGVGSVVRDNREVAQRAIARGHRFNRDLGYLEAEYAAHNELAWQRRVTHVLRFLFGPQEPRVTHAHVFAHANPLAPGATTGAVVQLGFEDGRRMTALPSLATVRSDAVANATVTDGLVRGVAPGMPTLTGEYGGARGVLRLAVRADTRSLAELIFELQTPTDTPSDAAVYLGGDLAPLGTWSANGVAFERVSTGAYRAAVLLPAGHAEYKYTRGTWETVEVNADRSDVDNRTVELRAAGAVFDRVERWRDR